jgi:hypothetical protein|tara:strand:- start:318 stop:548 length:231 start_codon:yes stop_codon:yes gene_type:complete
MVVSQPYLGTHFTIDLTRKNFVDIEFQVQPCGSVLTPEELILDHGVALHQQFLNHRKQADETIGIFKTHTGHDADV